MWRHIHNNKEIKLNKTTVYTPMMYKLTIQSLQLIPKIGNSYIHTYKHIYHTCMVLTSLLCFHTNCHSSSIPTYTFVFSWNLKKKYAFSCLPLLSNTVIRNNHGQAVNWSQYLSHRMGNVNINTVVGAKMPQFLSAVWMVKPTVLFPMPLSFVFIR